MLNAVVDTSVFIRGLLASPLNREVILSLRNFKFNLIISNELFDELLDVISRPKFQNIITAEEVHSLIELIKTQAKFVTPRHRVTVCRDTEDQKVLECALEGADLIVSHDPDLLTLKTFRGIPIITAKEFLRRLRR